MGAVWFVGMITHKILCKMMSRANQDLPNLSPHNLDHENINTEDPIKDIIYRAFWVVMQLVTMAHVTRT